MAEKIKEAREQGDLSENAEYDAAKDEQRDIEARIEELEKILKNAEHLMPLCSNHSFNSMARRCCLSFLLVRPLNLQHLSPRE